MIGGSCAEEFSRVREEFERNFADRGEVGASVCVMIDGEPVVDLWGGVADRETGRPWEQDTASVIFSCTKGATALCAHVLASRGQLDLAAPVARYWPEFGQSGKEDITVGMLLSHQSGLPVISTPLPDSAFFDWDRMIGALEVEKPLWEPGTRHGYHALTFGWLIGEVVHRVSGKSLGEFFRDEVAGPLGLDFWIGCPEEVEPRLAPMIFPEPREGDEPSLFMTMAATKPESIPGQIFANSGGYMLPGPTGFDSRNAHAAEIGAAGGISNARGLAGMYAPLACGGGLAGVELVDRRALARMTTTVSAGHDETLLIGSRFSAGYFRSIDNRHRPYGLRDSVILSADAFGHPGFGGSLGFASPDNRMSFGYTMNNMGPGTLLNDRGQSLVDAVYRSLGYTDNSTEVWC
ncbi:serine hydrolase domain-containing protein [Amycolatopsis viridis]|uniref:CubicO group peptidase (Beta-lactamase class C family) n=1 Tax=Amycolatopsis viridis TaxID=185678 RepID=A0ABX0T0N0_9PSEU|nr:serine hydrolase domain-containing protein [Amycolatopsis viridis]NIH82766.1 CubicO group peptidase (beta-lactamase class C family) [Amycolatopsis viridis]